MVSAAGGWYTSYTMMMEMFGGVFVMMLFAYSLIPLFPFVYVVLRWRQAREGEPADPQLGLKVALHYFATLGMHVVLIALVAVLYSFLVDSKFAQEMMMRSGGGLLIGGGVVYGVHRAMLARVTDSARRPNVARVFAGLNVVLCGLIGMSALIIASVMLCQEHVSEDGLKIAFVLMLVYLGAWGLHARRLIGYIEAAKPVA